MSTQKMRLRSLRLSANIGDNFGTRTQDRGSEPSFEVLESIGLRLVVEDNDLRLTPPKNKWAVG